MGYSSWDSKELGTTEQLSRKTDADSRAKAMLTVLQTRGPRTGWVSPVMEKERQGVSLVVKAAVGFEELQLVSLPW